MQRGALLAAAAVLFAALYVGRHAIDTMMGPSGARATVISADGGLTAWPLVRDCPPKRVARRRRDSPSRRRLGERESFRTGPGARAVLRLADGLIVDVNERTELFVTAAWSGQAIHLQRGDIVVKAAQQRRGRLQVLTRIRSPR